MELRDWLMAAGAVLILLILVDGWRRISGGSNRIRMKIDPSSESTDTDETADKHNPELPNGGARVKRKVERPDIDALMAAEAQQASQTEDPLETLTAQPEQSSVEVEPVIDDPLADLRVDDLEPDPFDSLSDEGIVSAPRKTNIKPSEPTLSTDSPEPEYSPELESSPELEDSPEPANSPEPVNSPEPKEILEQPNEEAVLEESVQEEAIQEEFVQEEPAAPEVEIADESPEGAVEQEVMVEETAESEPEPEPVSEQPIGHVDDLFGLDLDRPIHELVDAGAKKEKPARKRKSPAKKPEPEISEFDQLLEPNADAVDEPLEDIESLVNALPEIEEPELIDQSEVIHDSETQEAAVAAASSSTGRQFRELDLSDPETRLVVFVVAPKGGSLSGAHIQTVVERCGMEFGQMDLFHRFEDNSDHSPIQFTMSDVGEPGSFNIETLADHETPAVTFFMSMTEPRDPSYAVDCMLATAETLAKALGGEMLDSDRSVMRPQTQEHYRELVKAYKLRSRAKSRRTRKSK